MKPLIGINAGVVSGGPGELPGVTVRTSYIDAVNRAGGTPIVLPAVPDPEIVKQHVDLCAGFIFIGGPDIHPEKYGQQDIHPTSNLLPERRQNYDFMLIGEVIGRKKPFLAVCLGCQEVNVFLGGTLIQDIASQTGSTVQHSCKQAPHYMRQVVDVEPGTLTATMVGEGRVNANTAHHQAIGEPGKGIRISSRCPEDGIIESYELENYPFGVALQWHPEMLVDEPAHMNLFKGLVKAAG